ncbi:MAG TPA: hypothetical protein PKL77_09565, partial [Candidatus Omnitrophota bacterium]|nr:hypothetical protein [Candidatus Omnitrophota bacterium]
QQWSGSLSSIPLKDGTTLTLTTPVVIQDGIFTESALTKPDAQGKVYSVTMGTDGSIQMQGQGGVLITAPVSQPITVSDLPSDFRFHPDGTSSPVSQLARTEGDITATLTLNNPFTVVNGPDGNPQIQGAQFTSAGMFKQSLAGTSISTLAYGQFSLENFALSGELTPDMRALTTQDPILRTTISGYNDRIISLNSELNKAVPGSVEARRLSEALSSEVLGFAKLLREKELVPQSFNNGISEHVLGTFLQRFIFNAPPAPETPGTSGTVNQPTSAPQELPRLPQAALFDIPGKEGTYLAYLLPGAHVTVSGFSPQIASFMADFRKDTAGNPFWTTVSGVKFHSPLSPGDIPNTTAKEFPYYMKPGEFPYIGVTQQGFVPYNTVSQLVNHPMAYSGAAAQIQGINSTMQAKIDASYNVSGLIYWKRADHGNSTPQALEQMTISDLKGNLYLPGDGQGRNAQILAISQQRNMVFEWAKGETGLRLSIKNPSATNSLYLGRFAMPKAFTRLSAEEQDAVVATLRQGRSDQQQLAELSRGITDSATSESSVVPSQTVTFKPVNQFNIAASEDSNSVEASVFKNSFGTLQLSIEKALVGGKMIGAEGSVSPAYTLPGTRLHLWGFGRDGDDPTGARHSFQFSPYAGIAPDVKRTRGSYLLVDIDTTTARINSSYLLDRVLIDPSMYTEGSLDSVDATQPRISKAVRHDVEGWIAQEWRINPKDTASLPELIAVPAVSRTITVKSSYLKQKADNQGYEWVHRDADTVTFNNPVIAPVANRLSDKYVWRGQEQFSLPDGDSGSALIRNPERIFGLMQELGGNRPVIFFNTRGGITLAGGEGAYLDLNLRLGNEGAPPQHPEKTNYALYGGFEASPARNNLITGLSDDQNYISVSADPQFKDSSLMAVSLNFTDTIGLDSIPLSSLLTPYPYRASLKGRHFETGATGRLQFPEGYKLWIKDREYTIGDKEFMVQKFNFAFGDNVKSLDGKVLYAPSNAYYFIDPSSSPAFLPANKQFISDYSSMDSLTNLAFVLRHISLGEKGIKTNYPAIFNVDPVLRNVRVYTEKEHAARWLPTKTGQITFAPLKDTDNPLVFAFNMPGSSASEQFGAVMMFSQGQQWNKTDLNGVFYSKLFNFLNFGPLVNRNSLTEAEQALGSALKTGKPMRSLELIGNVPIKNEGGGIAIGVTLRYVAGKDGQPGKWDQFVTSHGRELELNTFLSSTWTSLAEQAQKSLYPHNISYNPQTDPGGAHAMAIARERITEAAASGFQKYLRDMPQFGFGTDEAGQAVLKRLGSYYETSNWQSYLQKEGVSINHWLVVASLKQQNGVTMDSSFTDDYMAGVDNWLGYAHTLGISQFSTIKQSLAESTGNYLFLDAKTPTWVLETLYKYGCLPKGLFANVGEFQQTMKSRPTSVGFQVDNGTFFVAPGSFGLARQSIPLEAAQAYLQSHEGVQSAQRSLVVEIADGRRGHVERITDPLQLTQLAKEGKITILSQGVSRGNDWYGDGLLKRIWRGYMNNPISMGIYNGVHGDERVETYVRSGGGVRGAAAAVVGERTVKAIESAPRRIKRAVKNAPRALKVAYMNNSVSNWVYQRLGGDEVMPYVAAQLSPGSIHAVSAQQGLDVVSAGQSAQRDQPYKVTVNLPGGRTSIHSYSPAELRTEQYRSGNNGFPALVIERSLLPMTPTRGVNSDGWVPLTTYKRGDGTVLFQEQINVGGRPVAQVGDKRVLSADPVFSSAIQNNVDFRSTVINGAITADVFKQNAELSQWGARIAKKADLTSLYQVAAQDPRFSSLGVSQSAFVGGLMDGKASSRLVAAYGTAVTVYNEKVVEAQKVITEYRAHAGEYYQNLVETYHAANQYAESAWYGLQHLEGANTETANSFNNNVVLPYGASSPDELAVTMTLNPHAFNLVQAHSIWASTYKNENELVFNNAMTKLGISDAMGFARAMELSSQGAGAFRAAYGQRFTDGDKTFSSLLGNGAFGSFVNRNMQLSNQLQQSIAEIRGGDPLLSLQDSFKGGLANIMDLTYTGKTLSGNVNYVDWKEMQGFAHGKYTNFSEYAKGVGYNWYAGNRWVFTLGGLVGDSDATHTLSTLEVSGYAVVAPALTLATAGLAGPLGGAAGGGTGAAAGEAVTLTTGQIAKQIAITGVINASANLGAANLLSWGFTGHALTWQDNLKLGLVSFATGGLTKGINLYATSAVPTSAVGTLLVNIARNGASLGNINLSLGNIVHAAAYGDILSGKEMATSYTQGFAFGGLSGGLQYGAKSLGGVVANFATKAVETANAGGAVWTPFGVRAATIGQMILDSAGVFGKVNVVSSNVLATAGLMPGHTTGNPLSWSEAWGTYKQGVKTGAAVASFMGVMGEASSMAQQAAGLAQAGEKLTGFQRATLYVSKNTQGFLDGVGATLNQYIPLNKAIGAFSKYPVLGWAVAGAGVNTARGYIISRVENKPYTLREGLFDAGVGAAMAGGARYLYSVKALSANPGVLRGAVIWGNSGDAMQATMAPWYRLATGASVGLVGGTSHTVVFGGSDGRVPTLKEIIYNTGIGALGFSIASAPSRLVNRWTVTGAAGNILYDKATGKLDNKGSQEWLLSGVRGAVLGKFAEFTFGGGGTRYLSSVGANASRYTSVEATAYDPHLFGIRIPAEVAGVRLYNPAKMMLTGPQQFAWEMRLGTAEWPVVSAGFRAGGALATGLIERFKNPVVASGMPLFAVEVNGENGKPTYRSLNGTDLFTSAVEGAQSGWMRALIGAAQADSTVYENRGVLAATSTSGVLGRMVPLAKMLYRSSSDVFAEGRAKAALSQTEGFGVKQFASWVESTAIGMPLVVTGLDQTVNAIGFKKGTFANSVLTWGGFLVAMPGYRPMGVETGIMESVRQGGYEKTRENVADVKKAFEVIDSARENARAAFSSVHYGRQEMVARGERQAVQDLVENFETSITQTRQQINTFLSGADPSIVQIGGKSKGPRMNVYHVDGLESVTGQRVVIGQVGKGERAGDFGIFIDSSVTNNSPEYSRLVTQAERATVRQAVLTPEGKAALRANPLETNQMPLADFARNQSGFADRVNARIARDGTVLISPRSGETYSAKTLGILSQARVYDAEINLLTPAERASLISNPASPTPREIETTTQDSVFLKPAQTVVGKERAINGRNRVELLHDGDRVLHNGEWWRVEKGNNRSPVRFINEKTNEVLSYTPQVSLPGERGIRQPQGKLRAEQLRQVSRKLQIEADVRGRVHEIVANGEAFRSRTETGTTIDMPVLPASVKNIYSTLEYGSLSSTARENFFKTRTLGSISDIANSDDSAGTVYKNALVTYTEQLRNAADIEFTRAAQGALHLIVARGQASQNEKEFQDVIGLLGAFANHNDYRTLGQIADTIGVRLPAELYGVRNTEFFASAAKEWQINLVAKGLDARETEAGINNLDSLVLFLENHGNAPTLLNSELEKYSLKAEDAPQLLQALRNRQDDITTLREAVSEAELPVASGAAQDRLITLKHELRIAETPLYESAFAQRRLTITRNLDEVLAQQAMLMPDLLQGRRSLIDGVRDGLWLQAGQVKWLSPLIYKGRFNAVLEKGVEYANAVRGGASDTDIVRIDAEYARGLKVLGLMDSVRTRSERSRLLWGERNAAENSGSVSGVKVLDQASAREADMSIMRQHWLEPNQATMQADIQAVYDETIGLLSEKHLPRFGDSRVQNITPEYQAALGDFFRGLTSRGLAQATSSEIPVMHPEVASRVADVLIGADRETGRDTGKGIIGFSLAKTDGTPRLLQMAQTIRDIAEGYSISAGMSEGKSIAALRALIEHSLTGRSTLLQVKNREELEKYEEGYADFARVFGFKLVRLEDRISRLSQQTPSEIHEVLDVLSSPASGQIPMVTYSEFPHLLNIARDVSSAARVDVDRFWRHEANRDRLTIYDEGQNVVIDSVQAIHGDGGTRLHYFRASYEPLFKALKNDFDTVDAQGRKLIRERAQFNEGNDSGFEYIVKGRNEETIVMTDALYDRYKAAGKDTIGREYSRSEVASVLRAIKEGSDPGQVCIYEGQLKPRQGIFGVQAERILQDPAYLTAKALEWERPEHAEMWTRAENAAGRGDIDWQAIWRNTEVGGKTLAAASPLEMFSRLGGKKVMLSATLGEYETAVRHLTGMAIKDVGKQNKLEIRDGEMVLVEQAKGGISVVKTSVKIEVVDPVRGQREGRAAIDAMVAKVEEIAHANRSDVGFVIATSSNEDLTDLHKSIAERLPGRRIEVIRDDTRETEVPDITRMTAEGAIVITTEKTWEGADFRGDTFLVTREAYSKHLSLVEQLIGRINRGESRGGTAHFIFERGDLEGRVRDMLANYGDTLSRRWSEGHSSEWDLLKKAQGDLKDMSTQELSMLALHLNQAKVNSDAAIEIIGRIFDIKAVHEPWQAFMDWTLQTYGQHSREYQWAKEFETREILDPHSDLWQERLLLGETHPQDSLQNVFDSTKGRVEWVLQRILENKGKTEYFTQDSPFAWNGSSARFNVENIFKAREFREFDNGRRSWNDVEARDVSFADARTVEDLVALSKMFSRELLPTFKTSGSSRTASHAAVVKGADSILDSLEKAARTGKKLTLEQKQGFLHEVERLRMNPNSYRGSPELITAIQGLVTALSDNEFTQQLHNILSDVHILVTGSQWQQFSELQRVQAVRVAVAPVITALNAIPANSQSQEDQNRRESLWAVLDVTSRAVNPTLSADRLQSVNGALARAQALGLPIDNAHMPVGFEEIFGVSVDGINKWITLNRGGRWYLDWTSPRAFLGIRNARQELASQGIFTPETRPYNYQASRLLFGFWGETHLLNKGTLDLPRMQAMANTFAGLAGRQSNRQIAALPDDILLGMSETAYRQYQMRKPEMQVKEEFGFFGMISPFNSQKREERLRELRSGLVNGGLRTLGAEGLRSIQQLNSFLMENTPGVAPAFDRLSRRYDETVSAQLAPTLPIAQEVLYRNQYPATRFEQIGLSILTPSTSVAGGAFALAKLGVLGKIGIVAGSGLLTGGWGWVIGGAAAVAGLAVYASKNTDGTAYQFLHAMQFGSYSGERHEKMLSAAREVMKLASDAAIDTKIGEIEKKWKITKETIGVPDDQMAAFHLMLNGFESTELTQDEVMLVMRMQGQASGQKRTLFRLTMGSGVTPAEVKSIVEKLNSGVTDGKRYFTADDIYKVIAVFPRSSQDIEKDYSKLLFAKSQKLFGGTGTFIGRIASVETLAPLGNSEIVNEYAREAIANYVFEHSTVAHIDNYLTRKDTGRRNGDLPSMSRALAAQDGLTVADIGGEEKVEETLRSRRDAGDKTLETAQTSARKRIEMLKVDLDKTGEDALQGEARYAAQAEVDILNARLNTFEAQKSSMTYKDIASWISQPKQEIIDVLASQIAQREAPEVAVAVAPVENVQQPIVTREKTKKERKALRDQMRLNEGSWIAPSSKRQFANQLAVLPSRYEKARETLLALAIVALTAETPEARQQAKTALDYWHVEYYQAYYYNIYNQIGRFAYESRNGISLGKGYEYWEYRQLALQQAIERSPLSSEHKAELLDKLDAVRFSYSTDSVSQGYTLRDALTP